MKALIINADDFGMTESCTAAIVDAFNKGIITDTTLCANGNYYNKAINAIFKNNIENKVGVHLNLTEGIPLTDQIKNDGYFCDSEGYFHGKFNRIKPISTIQKSIVYNEFLAQIQKLHKSGISITHGDSHHHIHTALYISSIVVGVLKDCGVEKIRISRNIGDMKWTKKIAKLIYNRKFKKDFITTNYFGSIQDVEYENQLLNDKSLEIMVHPDYNENGILIDRRGIDKDGIPTGEDLCFLKKFVSMYNTFSYFNLQEKLIT